MYEGRACYLEDKFPGEEKHTMEIPVFDESVGTPPISFKKQTLSLNELFEVMDEIDDHYLNMPSFEVLRTYFISPEVCPTALSDSYMIFLIDAEQAAREYHTLPYGGGLWDQPLALISAFNTIRSERNQFERVKIEAMKRKSKTKDSTGDKQTGSSPNESLPPRKRNVS